MTPRNLKSVELRLATGQFSLCFQRFKLGFAVVLVILLFLANGCKEQEQKSEMIGEHPPGSPKLIRSIGLFFNDKNSGMWRHSVLINGKEEISVAYGIHDLMERVRKLSVNRIVVSVGKAPPDNLVETIRQLQEACEKESIELDLSRDDLFYLRDGPFILPGGP